MRNRFGKPPGRGRKRLGILLPVALFCGMVALFGAGVSRLSDTGREEALEAAQRAVMRSVITFYAIEGRYPPSIDYLTQNHGLSVDRQRYIVHYDIFADNIMPQVVVLPRDF